MKEKKIKNLIKEVKENNKNLVLMLNRVLDGEEIKWLYENSKPKHQEGWIKENGKLIYYGPNGEKYE